MRTTITQSGDYPRLRSFLRRASTRPLDKLDLDKFGQMGVDALRQYTPKDTGETAAAWYYEIIEGPDSVTIEWSNSVLIDTIVPLVVLLQYGHGTRGGGYVQGEDYINPALRPVFDEIIDEAMTSIMDL